MGFLSYGWWLPTTTTETLQCATNGVHVDLSYGQFNNQLTTFAHALAYSATHRPHPIVFIPPPVLKEWQRFYDLNATLQGWACVYDVTVFTPARHVRRIESDKMYMLAHGAAGDAFVQKVVSSILLNPRRSLVVQLEEAQRKWPNGWYAIHIRALCGIWVTDALVRACTNAQSADDFCSLEYFRISAKNLRTERGPRPLLLLHDTVTPSSKIVNFMQAAGGVELHGTVHEDMVLMIHANFFLGNMASTLSHNVCRARQTIFPHDSQHRTNLYYNELACFDFVPGRTPNASARALH
jgi:hypothetical protein